MSKNLSDVAQKQFFAEVKHAYQATGKLRPTVRVKTDVVGSTAEFRKMGKGLATKRTPQSEVTPMNVTYSTPTVTLEDWNAAEYTDLFDDAKTNVDERQELAKTIGGAISRRQDQLIIDAINAETYSGSQAIAETFGSSDAFTTDKIREASVHFDDLEIPESDRHIMATSKAKAQLLGTTAPTSSDFAAVKALVNGDMDSWMGFDFHWLGSRSEGGLPVSGNIETNFAYHTPSVGLAVGIDFRTEVNYVPNRTSWLSNGLFSAGSVVIDTDGIVEIKSDNSVDVSQGTNA